MNDDTEHEHEIDFDDDAVMRWLDSPEGKHVEKMLSNLFNGFLVFWIKYRAGEDARPNEHHEQLCEQYEQTTALMSAVFSTLHDAIVAMDNPRPAKSVTSLLSKVLN